MPPLIWFNAPVDGYASNCPAQENSKPLYKTLDDMNNIFPWWNPTTILE